MRKGALFAPVSLFPRSSSLLQPTTLSSITITITNTSITVLAN